MSTNIMHQILWNDCWYMNASEFNNYIAWLPKEILEDILHLYVKTIFDYLLHCELIDWSYLGNNPGLTLDFIEKHIERQWDWSMLSYHPNLTIDFIEKYIEKPWDWSNFCNNSIITTNFIEKHIDKP